MFCRIASGELRAHVVYEDDVLCAFLDRGPIRPGHTQIVPKQHVACFDEAPADVVAKIAVLGQQLATAMKRLYRVDRVAFLFTGGDVPHLHAHIVPMHEKTDVTSRRYILDEAPTFRTLPDAPEHELAETAAALLRALGR